MTDHAPPTPKRRGRRIPPWYVLLLLLGPVGLLIWLRTGDRTGDAGMTNFFTTALGLVTVVILLAWFIFARGYRRRTRLLTVTGLFVFVVAFVATFRVEAFTGSIVPIFTPRWASTPPPPAIDRASHTQLADLATTTPFDFPGFLGPRRDQTVTGVTLARDWATQPPQLLWRQPIGSGWSGFAIVNGYALTTEERDGRQLVTAYEAETGKLVWSYDWPGAFDHSLGGPGPRSTPLVHDGRVYAMGPYGHLVCLDGSDGALVWEVDLRELQGIDPAADLAILVYGRSGSPIVHGELLIVPAGGQSANLANLVALDRRTGERVWRGSRHQLSYSSPVVATLGGVEQVLIVNESTVTGHDVATGRQLWKHPWPGLSNMNASSSQAVPVPPSSVFVSKGYGIGSSLIDLAPSADGTFEVTERWHHRRSMRTKHTNVVIREGFVYGLSDGILECIALENGERQWKGGRYGHGQILGVGDLLIVLSEEGELFLVEMRPDVENNVLGRHAGVDGLTWNNLALFRDLLLIRNGHEAAAYRLALGGE